MRIRLRSIIQLVLRSCVTRFAGGAEVATVFDVAKYILTKSGRISCMKLQKLVYYSQAWSLVWDDAPLFPEPIEAWVNGPVVPELYYAHKGQFDVTSVQIHGNIESLTDGQRETIDAIIDFYGKHSSQYLSDLSHNEQPWKVARQGLAPDARGETVITLDSMAEYYGSLTKNADGQESQ